MRHTLRHLQSGRTANTLPRSPVQGDAIMFRIIRSPRSKAYLASLALCMIPSIARAAGGPNYIPGQIVLYCQPGTAMATVNTLATSVGATVTPLLFPDCYQLTLPVANADVADTMTAVSTLKLNNQVRWAGPNYTQTLAAAAITPNDPMYSNQWALPQVNMPEAWVLEKGIAGVVVADIDSGFDVNHPDMTTQYLLPGYNSSDGSTNIAPPNTTQDGEHGEATSGVIDAATNNGVGIASVDGWGGIKVLPIRDDDSTGAGTLAYYLSAVQYVITNQKKDNIVAVNMSFGFSGIPATDTTNPIYQSIQSLSNAGIIICASAGNESTVNTTDAGGVAPSEYQLPLQLTVSALNRSSKLAYYSDTGNIEVSAPGGEQFSATDPNGMLVIYNGGYDYEMGTSFSAPMVTGLAGLMMSVPGVTPAQAVKLIETEANHTITGQSTVPDTTYGYGEIDAYASLLPVSYSASISSPIGLTSSGQTTNPAGTPPPPVETLKPTITFQVTRIPIANVVVTLNNPDGSTTNLLVNDAPQAGVSDFTTSGDTSGQNGPYTFSLRYALNNALSIQNISVTITATPTDNTVPPVTDTRIFTIEPHTIPAGLNLVSFPYVEDATDSPTGTVRTLAQITNTPSAISYRYVPQLLPGGASPYASLGTSSDIQPASASLNPPDAQVSVQGVTGTVTPLGLGYFVNLPAAAQYRDYGVAYSDNVVSVPLHAGWNMIGDPFPFTVPFVAVQFLTNAGVLDTATQAATDNLVLPYLYTYTGSSYQFSQLPSGNLTPWQGAWIYVEPPTGSTLPTSSDVITMEVPPAGTVENNRAAAKVQSQAQWTLALQASSGGESGTAATIGIANSTVNRSSVQAPEPPSIGHYISVTTTESGTPPLMENLKSAGAAVSWNVQVTTDKQPNGKVVFQWPGIMNVPRTWSLTLNDPVTGESINMRSNSAYVFEMPSGTSTRSLTITASPDNTGGRALLTGLTVTQMANRGATGSIFNIQYGITRAATVDVSIMGSNGQLLDSLAPSRAVSTGINRLVWNGSDAQGRLLPAGVYTLQVRAVTSSGQVTRMIYPITLVGR